MTAVRRDLVTLCARPPAARPWPRPCSFCELAGGKVLDELRSNCLADRSSPASGALLLRTLRDLLQKPEPVTWWDVLRGKPNRSS